MADLGGDAFRFSSQPALGGRGFVFELVKRESVATVTITWARGHPGYGWERTRRRSVTITHEEFDWIMSSVDALLADGQPSQVYVDADEQEIIVLCTDGPGYRSERVHENTVTWLTGFCGVPDHPHPNTRIADILLSWFFDRAGD